MDPQIRLISHLRHLKRREHTVTTGVFAVTGLCICGMLIASSRSKLAYELACGIGSVTTLMVGQRYLSKLNREECQIRRELWRIQRERQ